MPNTQITETVPFNYNELYAGIQTKFANAGYDVYPGSNVSQLVTSMAYFTSMLNVGTAVNINETLLPLATQRDNVLQDARALGYEIQHKQSFTYTLTLTLSGSSTGNYIIPKYTMFTEGANTYYYMGAQLDLIGQLDGTVIELLVVQGTLYQYGDYPNSLTVETVLVQNDALQMVPQYYVDIPFIDIEENGIECFVSYYDNFGNLVQNEQWLKSTQFIIDKDLVLKNRFFRLDDIKFKTPRIYFELSGIGNGLKVGTTVNLNVLQTAGINGAMNKTDGTGIAHTLPNVTVSKVVLTSQGTDEETIQSIKLNAPLFQNSANRAVTANDYRAICNRQSSVKDSFIWGGEDEFPKSPGHIWFSLLPSSLERIYTSDTFNTLYTLNNPSYNTWDYTFTPAVDPINAPGPYEQQVADALAFYSLRYIDDAEIRSTQVTNTGQLIQPGVWDIVDKYKIPTLSFHTRHPIYLDYDYTIEILKYDVVTSKSAINNNVFNVVDGFFSGVNDTFTMETFGETYFHSSLEKRIDSLLTDASGYNNSVINKLSITYKNVQRENSNWDYRDIFIPLSTPLEPYFDTSGTLLYSVLPSIDTNNFLYNLSTGVNITGTNMYTDWSTVQTEINNGTKHNQQDIIVAPIRIKLTETISTGGTAITSVNGIYPDDPSVIDLTGTPTYNKTILTHIASNGTETVLVRGTDWTHDPYTDVFSITLTNALLAGESVRIDTDAACGSYILFNSFKKYITVQLNVDARGFLEPSITGKNYNLPKSYLTTTDTLYNYSTDAFYLTTDGYSITSQSQVNSLTGPIVKAISPSVYFGSPIKMDLFRNDRQIDLLYNSPNFKIDKNIMPRLRSVTFK